MFVWQSILVFEIDDWINPDNEQLLRKHPAVYGP